MHATGFHSEDRSTRLARWLLMLQGELGDHPAEERRGRLAEALRSSLGTGSSAERLQVLSEVEEWVAPGNADLDLDGSVVSARARDARGGFNSDRGPAPADGPRGARDTGFAHPLADPALLDPAVAARVALDRFSELPPELIDELCSRASARRPVRVAGQEDASGSTPAREELRRVLKIPREAPIDPERVDRLVASLYREARLLIHALAKVLGASWDDTANQRAGLPRLPRLDEIQNELREYLVDGGSDDPSRLGVLRAVVAARCLVDTIESALSQLPDELERLRPEAIKKAVRDGAGRGAQRGFAASLLGGTRSDEQCWWEHFEELVKHNLQFDALRTAYITQFVEGAAESFKHAVRQ